MIHLAVLNKEEKDRWLDQLFDLFYENMHLIAPSGIPYEQEKQQWISQVSPALEKAPRQIILCIADDVLAGYAQYYTNKNLLMIEEIQIAKTYQQTTLFYSMCKYLAKLLPEGIEVVEAYAEKRNLQSRKLMEKFAMKQIGEDGPFVHFQGSAEILSSLTK